MPGSLSLPKKNRIISLLVAALLITGAASTYAANYKGRLTIVTSDGREHPFDIELAITPQQQAKGLMFRESMPENAGMLFLFTEERERSFWMKNTLIHLDLIFIKADGTIHHIRENAIPRDLTSIKSNGPVSAVLEINGGRSAELGIEPGDTVRHRFFTNKLAQ